MKIERGISVGLNSANSYCDIMHNMVTYSMGSGIRVYNLSYSIVKSA